MQPGLYMRVSFPTSTFSSWLLCGGQKWGSLLSRWAKIDTLTVAATYHLVSSIFFPFAPDLSWLFFSLQAKFCISVGGSCILFNISLVFYFCVGRDFTFFMLSSRREGNGTPLQYSCLENPMDGGAWWAVVYGIAKSRIRLSDFTFNFPLSCIGEGNGNPLQCSCLENPRDRGAWWAAVCGVAQSRTQLKQLSSSSISSYTK